MKPPLFIGLMSGTSLDGVDAALVDFSAARPRTLATHFAPFDAELRACLLALQAPGDNEIERAALAANELAQAYATGVAAVLGLAGVSATRVRAIGAHGQTVRHRPEAGFTSQLNNPALLAELCGIDVVAEFRTRDVAAGGQGAPLAPAFHHAYFSSPDAHRAVLNLGGIANLTLLVPGATVLGFDTGPGNVLMDLWCHRHTGRPFDKDGAWSSTGRVRPDLLGAMLAEPYFGTTPPKSTGRDRFNERWLESKLAVAPGAATQDVQATLLELTALTVSRSLAQIQAEVVYACGGGAHNARLMARLADCLAPARVADSAELGVPADWVEAVAFAWLARQHVEGRCANLPAVTGARGARRLGALFPA